MSYSMPTYFASEHGRSGIAHNIIVKLTDGVSTWLFGTTEMNITDGHVYALLSNISEINFAIDIFTKDWSIGNVTITLANANYRKNSSMAWVKSGDELGDIALNTAYIYLASGNNITALSDCLNYFTGTVVAAPVITMDNMEIELCDKSYGYNKVLPANLLTAAGTPILDEDYNRKLPLVYGTFARADWNNAYATNGLMKGFGVELSANAIYPAKFFIAGHPLKTAGIGDLYIGTKGKVPFLCDSTIKDDDDANHRAYVRHYYLSSYGDSDCYIIFELNSNPPEGTDGYTTVYDATDPDNAHDDNNTTYSEITDNIADDWYAPESLYRVEGAADWGIISENILRDLLLDSNIAPKVYLQYKNIAFGPGKDVHNFIDSGSGIIVCYLRYAESGLTSFISINPNEIPIVTTSWITTSAYKAAVDITSSDVPLALRLYFRGNTGDGTLNNEAFLRIYELRLRLVKSFNYRQLDRGKSDWMMGYASGTGRAFGSWIDESGWSNSLNSGDLIDKPNFIIASILIDELGLTHSDLDKSSFDAADDNTTLATYMDQYEDIDSFDLVKKICEQSTFAFCFSGTGKAKLIPLDDTSVTITKTIYFFNLIKGSFRISKSDWLVNYLNHKSRYQEEYNLFRDTGTEQNATSQSAYGIKKYDAEWPNISGSSVTELCDHLVGDANAIWANEHNIIEFETPFFVNAELEIGDYIELDATTFDAQQKCYGITWSGKQFLIIETRQNWQTTYIKAVQLY